MYYIKCSFLFFFFFKQKTAYEMRISDWSSDVCSSDLDSRIAVKAHSVRIEHIAFGAGDGIVLTSSAGSNMMGLDPEGVPNVWDARSGELLLALPGDWSGGPMIASPVSGFYLVSRGSTSTRLNFSHYCASRMPPFALTKNVSNHI